jgi:hypothetical protein
MVQRSGYLWGHDKGYHMFYISLFLLSCSRRGGVFKGALISASSLGLASFFGSIISHFCSYQIQQHYVRITETTSHQLLYDK